ncbi:hypothetical protein QYF36_007900 [Acer negundo]|nr:hypothetical protein QYF36_007900 [Acer negundo]
MGTLLDNFAAIKEIEIEEAQERHCHWQYIRIMAFKIIVTDPDTFLNTLTREVKETGPYLCGCSCFLVPEPLKFSTVYVFNVFTFIFYTLPPKDGSQFFKEPEVCNKAIKHYK